MTYFRAFLILATATFMAFHVQIFVSRIEPNPIFSWTAAIVIEGFLISLAMTKTIASRVLLIPVFLISVIAASASYAVQDEQTLRQFFTQQRMVEQLQTDIARAQEAYAFGERYVTRTLIRERQLQDELRAVLGDKTGDIAVANFAIFLVLVFVMQGVSVYTAMSIKDELTRTESGKIPERSAEVERVGQEVERHGTEVERLWNDSGTVERPAERHGTEVDMLREMKKTMSLSQMSDKLGISKTTLTRILKTQKLTPEIAEKLQALLPIYNKGGEKK